MNRPTWTDKQGNPRPLTEYDPGRWTGMIVNAAELREHQARRAVSARAFEADLEAEFGPGLRCPSCNITLSVPFAPCPDGCPSGERPLTDYGDFERCNIPIGYLRSATIASFEGPGLKSLATDWTATWPPKKPLLFFVGGRGNGKTHLSAAILRAVWEKHRIWGKFCQVSEMLNAVRASYDPKSEISAAGIMSPLRMAPLLVLDDIGVGKQTDWVDEQLWLLVSWRYTRGLPTIASANPDGLEKVEARVKERLMDRQTGTTWEFTGRNRRTT